MATCSSILAWRIPWPGESGGLQSMGSQESDMAEQQNMDQHLPFFLYCIWFKHLHLTLSQEGAFRIFSSQRQLLLSFEKASSIFEKFCSGYLL